MEQKQDNPTGSTSFLAIIANGGDPSGHCLRIPGAPKDQGLLGETNQQFWHFKLRLWNFLAFNSYYFSL